MNTKSKKHSRAAVVGMLDELIAQGVNPVSTSTVEATVLTTEPSPVSSMQMIAEKNPDWVESTNSSNSTFKELDETSGILSLDPALCTLWKFKDRPETELGDLEGLAADLKRNGQLQPGIVRRLKQSSQYKFEVIVGERRLRACKMANLKFLAIVKEIDDAEAAIFQSVENDQRKDLSDYAKGFNYHQLIENGVLTPKDLEEKLNKSQSYIRNLLSFARIPQRIWAAIGDVTRISARTAYELHRWLEKGQDYEKAILAIAPLLAKESIGEKRLQQLVLKHINQKEARLETAVEVKTNDGRHIFTWRKDTNGERSIAFPKTIRELVNFDILQNVITENILYQLKNKSNEE